MDISWFGQSCFKIKGKNAALVTDPFNSDATGLKKVKVSGDIVTVSHQHEDHNNTDAVEGEPFAILGAGEYEVKGIRIQGIQTFHDAKQGKERGMNTMYVIDIDGITILHCGDLGHELTSDQLEDIPDIDILMIPVGGVYTIDAAVAEKVIVQIEPKVIIPMHYKIPGLKFDLETVDTFLHVHGKASVTPVNKYSITKEKLPDNEEIVVLEV